MSSLSFQRSHRALIMHAAIALLLRLCAFIAYMCDVYISIDFCINELTAEKNVSESTNRACTLSDSIIMRSNYIIGDNLSAVFQARSVRAFSGVLRSIQTRCVFNLLHFESCRQQTSKSHKITITVLINNSCQF